MFLLRELFLVTSVLATFLPTRDIDTMMDATYSTCSCPRSLLMPEGRGRLIPEKKPILPLGIDGISDIDNFVESLPFEARWRKLDCLYASSRSRQLGLYVKDENSVALKRYTEYAISSMFMEAGVIRLLFRYAFRELLPEEALIDSASSMLTYLRNYFEQKFDYSLNHITPRILQEWYDLLGDSKKFVICTNHRYVNEEKLPDTALVALVLRPWEENIILPRMLRLRQTGYETIPQ